MSTHNNQAHARPDREHLAIILNVYETAISQLTKMFNATSLDKVSVFVSGKTDIRKMFHEIMHTGTNWDLPVPTGRLKEFFRNYCQDLISQRSILITQIEGLENPVLQRKDPAPDPENSILDKAIHHCSKCERPTQHILKQNGTVVYWYCHDCGNHNNNAEID